MQLNHEPVQNDASEGPAVQFQAVDEAQLEDWEDFIDVTLACEEQFLAHIYSLRLKPFLHNAWWWSARGHSHWSGTRCVECGVLRMKTFQTLNAVDKCEENDDEYEFVRCEEYK